MVVAVVDLLDDLDTPVARSRAVEYKAEIAAIDRKLAAALRVSPAGRLMARGQDLQERWEQMDATLRSQVIDELMVVTVLPAKRGRGFDDDSVDIAWRKTMKDQLLDRAAGFGVADHRGRVRVTFVQNFCRRLGARSALAAASWRSGSVPPCDRTSNDKERVGRCGDAVVPRAGGAPRFDICASFSAYRGATVLFKLFYVLVAAAQQVPRLIGGFCCAGQLQSTRRREGPWKTSIYRCQCHW